jgi:hypothetical protein
MFWKYPWPYFFSPNHTFASTCILARVWNPVIINEEYRFVDLSKKTHFIPSFKIFLLIPQVNFKVIVMQVQMGRRKCIPTHSQPGVKRRWVVGVTLRSPYRRQRPGTFCAGGWVGLEAGPDGAKNFAPSELDTRLVQPITSRYTDWANSAAYLSSTVPIILRTALRL